MHNWLKSSKAKLSQQKKNKYHWNKKKKSPFLLNEGSGDPWREPQGQEHFSAHPWNECGSGKPEHKNNLCFSCFTFKLQLMFLHLKKYFIPFNLQRHWGTDPVHKEHCLQAAYSPCKGRATPPALMATKWKQWTGQLPSPKENNQSLAQSLTWICKFQIKKGINSVSNCNDWLDKNLIKCRSHNLSMWEIIHKTEVTEPEYSSLNRLGESSFAKILIINANKSLALLKPGWTSEPDAVIGTISNWVSSTWELRQTKKSPVAVLVLILHKRTKFWRVMLIFRLCD